VSGFGDGVLANKVRMIVSGAQDRLMLLPDCPPG
jgi:hypothetical protein